MTNLFKGYVQNNSHAMRSEIPNCVCSACVAKRNAPPMFRRKPEAEIVRRIRKYESRRNQCSKCFEAKSANGSCACE